MPKYLLHVNYTSEGSQGLLKEGGSSRKAAAEAAVKSLGGSIEAMYYAFGETDCYVIAEMPSHHAVAALNLTLAASGRITCKTTVLMTPEDVDTAAKLSPAYRAPGQ